MLAERLGRRTRNLDELKPVDSLIIGGGMCFTFLKAQGHTIGSSLCEDDMVDTCRELLAGPKTIHLPYDITALGPGGKLFEPEAGGVVRQLGADLPDGWMGVDIGPGSAAAFGDVILEAGTVLWNGPMGVFEDPRFEAGTRAVAVAIAESRAFTPRCCDRWEAPRPSSREAGSVGPDSIRNSVVAPVALKVIRESSIDATSPRLLRELATLLILTLLLRS